MVIMPREKEESEQHAIYGYVALYACIWGITINKYCMEVFQTKGEHINGMEKKLITFSFLISNKPIND